MESVQGLLQLHRGYRTGEVPNLMKCGTCMRQWSGTCMYVCSDPKLWCTGDNGHIILLLPTWVGHRFIIDRVRWCGTHYKSLGKGPCCLQLDQFVPATFHADGVWSRLCIQRLLLRTHYSSCSDMQSSRNQRFSQELNKCTGDSKIIALVGHDWLLLGPISPCCHGHWGSHYLHQSLKPWRYSTRAGDLTALITSPLLPNRNTIHSWIQLWNHEMYQSNAINMRVFPIETKKPLHPILPSQGSNVFLTRHVLHLFQLCLVSAQLLQTSALLHQ